MQPRHDDSSRVQAIHDLLARFFQAFDEKDWAAMRDCLCDEVLADYSSFRGTPAATVPADRYVDERRTALQALDTQHDFTNLRVDVGETAETARARCNYAIRRFHATADDFFHSYGHYVFGLVSAGGQWRISRIRQKLLRNQGNPGIHGAARAPVTGRGSTD